MYPVRNLDKSSMLKQWDMSIEFNARMDKIKLCGDAIPWKISTKKLEPPKVAVHVFLAKIW